MLATQRQRKILDTVQRAGGARVAELAVRLEVTEETIRRDLDALAGAGRVLRRHGGAVPADGGDRELPHAERQRLNPLEKEAIAREAAGRARPGQTLLLDASSTALSLARHLPDQEQTVLTNSLLVAGALARHGQTRVVLIGGTLFKPSLSFLGPAAEQALRGYRADVLFFSARGLDAEWGLSDANEQQAALKRVMVEQSARRIVMADHSKFGIRAPDRIAAWKGLHEVITDAKAPRADVSRLERAGLKVTRVPARSRG